MTRKICAVLAFIALMAGQSLLATTKTVTYKITSVTKRSSYEIVFSRLDDATSSDDDPFDTSAPTTYKATTDVASIENGQSGYLSVMLADGFHLHLSWGENSSIRFTNNCIYPSATGKSIT